METSKYGLYWVMNPFLNVLETTLDADEYYEFTHRPGYKTVKLNMLTYISTPGQHMNIDVVNKIGYNNRVSYVLIHRIPKRAYLRDIKQKTYQPITRGTKMIRRKVS